MTGRVVVAAKLYARPAGDFPPVEDGTAAILVTLQPGDDELETFAVTTNIGGSLTAELISQLVGTLLHQLSHVMTAGMSVDVTDLNGPIPTNLAGGAG